MPVRKAANIFGVPRTTLLRFKCKVEACGLENVNFSPKNEHLKVFSIAEEDALANYLKQASMMNYGLTLKDAHKLAYDYAIAKQYNFRKGLENWNKDKMSEKEWIPSFLKRYKLSLRTADQTSLRRATSFNRYNVSTFYSNLKGVLDSNQFEPQDIYNLDETGCLTVHKPPKIIAAKGARQVGQATSAERGTLVTLCTIIGCTGKALPPYLIFPRKNYKEHVLKNAPAGSKGNATPTGWMQGELFEDVLRHFVKYERPTTEKPKLIFLDNHENHLNIQGLDYAKQNGLILLTFPPHCSHKLQLLDLSVFGPFKKYYNDACNRWMTNHPASVITIYDIAELVGDAFPKAFTVQNINSGFQKAGIWPFNDAFFTEVDFLPSSVTDRPVVDDTISGNRSIQNNVSTTFPSNVTIEEQPGCSKYHMPVAEIQTTSDNPSSINVEVQPGCSKYHETNKTTESQNTVSINPYQNTENSTSGIKDHKSSLKKVIPPETVRPFVKAPPRKPKGKGRKKGKSMVLTSTPVKFELEERAKERKQKRNLLLQEKIRLFVKF